MSERPWILYRTLIGLAAGGGVGNTLRHYRMGEDNAVRFWRHCCTTRRCCRWRTGAWAWERGRVALEFDGPRARRVFCEGAGDGGLVSSNESARFLLPVLFVLCFCISTAWGGSAPSDRYSRAPWRLSHCRALSWLLSLSGVWPL
jgi:hypothetical protein